MSALRRIGDPPREPTRPPWAEDGTPWPPPEGSPQRAQYLEMVVTELRHCLKDAENRIAARTGYMPGGFIPEGTSPEQVAQWQADYEADRDARARERALTRDADRELDRLAYEAVSGARRIMAWGEVVAQPKPAWVYGGLLTQGVYGVAGPPESGKSLLCRNWLCEIAAVGQNVLYAPTEGQFDMAERFGAHPQFQAAQPRLACLPEGAALSLASREDVAWLIGQAPASGLSLLAFDMIYGFGVADDNTVSDVAPVLAGCKRLAAELGAAVLITGHPGHGGQRRFRGSSMWRGAFDGEFHMADGQLTCEKHKYTDKKQITWPYVVEYPYLRVLQPMETMGRERQRFGQIAEDLRLHPGDSDSVRASRLAPQMGLSRERIRKLISAHRKAGQICNDHGG